eukprot:3670300-Rhodomonas_salina.2
MREPGMCLVALLPFLRYGSSSDVEVILRAICSEFHVIVGLIDHLSTPSNRDKVPYVLQAVMARWQELQCLERQGIMSAHECKSRFGARRAGFECILDPVARCVQAAYHHNPPR